MRWTTEEERTCLRMVQNGFTYDEIAEAVGRSTEAVGYYIYMKRKKEPGVWRKRTDTRKRSGQPCWTCFYGAGATDSSGWTCPWASRGEPVEGWDASPSRLQDCYGTKSKVFSSFNIRECPRYMEE